jgi:hypothetical protein
MITFTGGIISQHGHERWMNISLNAHVTCFDRLFESIFIDEKLREEKGGVE